MELSMKHPTTTIYVRAPVDTAIVPVVRALLAFPEVATLYSCQGTPATDSKGKEWNWPKDGAYIVFLVGRGTALELAVFLDFMVARIGDLSTYTQMEITVAGGTPQLELRTQHECIDKLAQWLLAIRKDWRGLTVELADQVALQLARSELAERVAKFKP
jgi:hypothetical protein